MIIKIQKFIVQSYGELFKEKTKKLLSDLFLLAFVVLIMFRIEKYTANASFILFDVTYRLDILLIYLLAFVTIITASVLFFDLRNFLNISTRFVITRFPRMNKEFGPGKMILMDLVQVTIAFLVFKPLSLFVSGYSINGFEINYLVSITFLILALIFAYDILANVKKMVSYEFIHLSGLLLKHRSETKNGQ